MVKDTRVEVHVVTQVGKKICSADIGENCPVSGCCGSRRVFAVEEEVADRVSLVMRPSVGFSVAVTHGVVPYAGVVTDAAACAARKE